jgi:hypothetical protein
LKRERCLHGMAPEWCEWCAGRIVLPCGTDVPPPTAEDES